MTDEKIIEMLFARDEAAIDKINLTYGRYFRVIARSVLRDDFSVEEVLSDVYLKAWNSIPPERPASIKAYLGRITRNLAINLLEKRMAKKRGGEEQGLILMELSQISGEDYSESISKNMDLSELINDFLRSLGDEERRIFIRRYWYCNSIAEIAEGYSLSHGKVKSCLMRTRTKLREALYREGFIEEG